MANRRDLFQSYQFMLRRLVSSLVLRETDPAQSPLRRMGGSGFASIMVAIIIAAVIGVLGAVNPSGNKTWQSAGKIIVQEDTGAIFVWVANAAGVFQLHPVPNMVSAALLMRTTAIVSVSAASLQGVPRANPLGIVGAPTTIPQPDQFNNGSWFLCSVQLPDESGQPASRVVIVIAQKPKGGQPIGSAAVVVSSSEAASTSVVWQGRQFPVANDAVVLGGLGLRNSNVVSVAPAWIAGMPAGSELVPVPAAGRGKPSAAVTGAIIGQVFEVTTGSTKQYYIAKSDQLQPISQTLALITLGDPAYPNKNGSPTALSAATLSSAKVATEDPPATSDPPANPPKPAAVSDQNATLCAEFKSGQSTPTISLGSSISGLETVPFGPSATKLGSALANQVAVNGSNAVLVRAVDSPTAPSGLLYLVTDSGLRFLIKDKPALTDLGLSNVKPIVMPASLVARIPNGPILDEQSAKGGA